MGAVPAAYYLPIFVVQEKGLLKKRGYETQVDMFVKNGDMMDAFLNGQVDIAAQGSGTLFPLEAKKPGRYTFIYGQNNRSYAFIVPVNSPLHSLADLKGKSVVTWPSPTAKLAIELSVEKFFDPKLVSVQPTDFKMINLVLEQKGVAAAFNTDVFTAQAIRTKKARYLDHYPLTEQVMDPFFNGGGFISPKLAQSNPQMAKDIEAAFSEAVDYIRNNNREARLLMEKYVPAAREDILTADLDDYIPVSKIDAKNAQRLADIFVKANMMDHSIQIAPLLAKPSTGDNPSTDRGTAGGLHK